MLTPYSIRGITQTLEPIVGASGSQDGYGTLLQRGTNGGIIDLTQPQFNKLSSEISVTDVNPPCFNEAWIGRVLTVWCAVERAYPTGGTPDRPIVPGSHERTEAGFTFFRPALTMTVTGYNQSFAEWKRDYSWKLRLQEN